MACLGQSDCIMCDLSILHSVMIFFSDKLLLRTGKNKTEMVVLVPSLPRMKIGNTSEDRLRDQKDLDRLVRLGKLDQETRSNIPGLGVVLVRRILAFW